MVKISTLELVLMVVAGGLAVTSASSRLKTQRRFDASVVKQQIKAIRPKVTKPRVTERAIPAFLEDDDPDAAAHFWNTETDGFEETGPTIPRLGGAEKAKSPARSRRGRAIKVSGPPARPTKVRDSKGAISDGPAPRQGTRRQLTAGREVPSVADKKLPRKSAS